MNLVEEYLDLMKHFYEKGAIGVTMYPQMEDINDLKKFVIEAQEISWIFTWFHGDNIKINNEIQTRNLLPTLKIIVEKLKELLKKGLKVDIIDSDDISLIPP